MPTAKKREVTKGPGIPGTFLFQSCVTQRHGATEGQAFPNCLCLNGIVNCLELEVFPCAVSNRAPK